jgi:Na+-transporting NADH:ubiquinone oxidoreductase subunit C
VRTDSPGYTLIFATAVCVVCALFVSASNVLLKERQEINQLLYLRKNVLQAAGIVGLGEKVPDREAMRLFSERIEPRLVDLKTGEYVSGIDPAEYDQREARGVPETSRPVPENPAGVRRVADLAKVYLVRGDSGFSHVVIPVEGLGLYGTLYGFLALAKDTTTIRGLSFYENKETPGLGAEVDDPDWKARWVGRKALDEAWKPRVQLVKGGVGPPLENPYEVDALSGATMTSNGVTRLLHFWLGEQGFGPFLRKVRERGGF